MIIVRSNYTIELDDNTGDILSFKGVTGYNYIEKTTSLVKIYFINKAGERVEALSNQASNIRLDGNVITIEYKEMSLPNVRVEATIDCTDNALADFRLRVYNDSSMKLEAIQYPCVIIKNMLAKVSINLDYTSLPCFLLQQNKAVAIQ
jgi:hypothetical protein